MFDSHGTWKLIIWFVVVVVVIKKKPDEILKKGHVNVTGYTILVVVDVIVLY